MSHLPKKNHNEFKLPLNLFIAIIALSVVIIGIVAYSFQLGYKMSVKFSPLVDASMEIKLEATTAHLWFEELISGDRDVTIEDVLKHIDNAIWYANAMLEGGENPEGNFIPLANPVMRKEIEEVLVKIKTFKEITKERYSTKTETGIGTPTEQRYDVFFENFLQQADLVETKLQSTIVSNLDKYRSMQLLLLVSLISLMVFLLFIFYRYEKQRARDLALIHAAHDEVKILSGFIPICSSCKQIRDDKGFWSQVEAYITKNSEAKFSHSICPKCVQKLYPEFYNEYLKANKQ